MGRASESKGKGKGKGKGGKGKDGKGKDGRGKGDGKGKGKDGKGKGKDGKEAGGEDAPARHKPVNVSPKAFDMLKAFSNPQWWLILPPAEEDGRRKRVKPEVFQQTCAEKHAEMVQAYESAMNQDSEQRWLRKVCSDGTAGDKAASMTMLVQVCPVLSTGYLKALLAMASKLGRSDGAMAVDALKDLFLGTLLPDRKLRTMSQMEPLSPKGLGEDEYTTICAVSFYEDYLKTVFAAFVQLLSETAHSAVPFFKAKAIRTAHELLASKPEQERALLGLIVNKFGDKASKISSNAAFCLKKLQEAHPAMKSVIAKEVEVFLQRPNVTEKSQYFALLYLSEMVLSRKTDGPLAVQLIKLYVARLQAALKGRAVPDRKELAKKGMRKKKLLAKIRLAKKAGLVADDNRMVRTLINGIQRALPYLESASLTAPLEDETVDALFKICHTVSSYSTRIAILHLLFRCLSARGSSVPDRFYRLLYEQVMQFDLFTSSHKHKALLLLRNSIPADVQLTRGIALGRRMLQVGANAEPPVAAAALTVCRELFVAHRPEVKTLLGTLDGDVQPPDGMDGEDDAEEHFVDDEAAQAQPAKLEGADAKSDEGYRPLAREPRFARARNTPMWELHALARHVHPFVAHGATRLLAAETYEDVGSNPFEAFSIQELLEQFVYTKKAKSNKEQKGKPLPGESIAGRTPMNSDKFLKKKNVLPHERFFKLYFADDVIQKQQKKKARQRDQDEEDLQVEDGGGVIGDDDGDQEEDAGDDEADEFFDSHLQEMMPKWDKGAGDEDVDVDDDSDDFDGDDSGEGGSESGEGDAGSEADQPFGAEGAVDAGEDEDEEDDDEQEEEPASKAEEGRGKKRKSEFVQKKEKIKALKKKHSGAMFASAEDFEQLIAADY